MKKIIVSVLLIFFLTACAAEKSPLPVRENTDYRRSPFSCVCTSENDDVAVSFSLKRDGDTYEVVILSPEECAGAVVAFNADRVDMTVNEFSVILSEEAALGLKAVPLALLHDTDGIVPEDGKYKFTECGFGALLTLGADGLPTELRLSRGNYTRVFKITEFVTSPRS